MFLLRTVGLAIAVAAIFGLVISLTPEMKERWAARAALGESTRQLRSGDAAGAVATLTASAKRAGAALGNDDSQVRGIFQQLGLASREKFGPDSPQAASAFRSAIGDTSPLSDRASASMVSASQSLGRVSLARSEFREAIFNLRFVAHHRARALGAESEAARIARMDLVFAYIGAGRLRRAESELRRLLIANANRPGGEERENFEGRRLLALVLCAQAQPGEAIALLSRKLGNRNRPNYAESAGKKRLEASLRECEALCIQSTPTQLRWMLERMIAARYLGEANPKTQALEKRIQVSASLAPPHPENVDFNWSSRPPEDIALKAQRVWGGYAGGLASAGWHEMAANLWREIYEHEKATPEGDKSQGYLDEAMARQLKAGGRDAEAQPPAERLVNRYLSKWNADARHDVVTRWNLLALHRFMGWKGREEQELRFLLDEARTSKRWSGTDRMKAQVELAEFLRDNRRFDEALALAAEPAMEARKFQSMDTKESKRAIELYDDVQQELRFPIPD